MTSNNGEIEVKGGGLPVWDPAGAEATRAPDAALRTGGLPQPEKEDQGSLIISCKVVFPESLGRRGGRLAGLEVAGAEDRDSWAERSAFEGGAGAAS